MLGLRDKVGRLEIKGLGINLTSTSTQAKFERALELVPKLKGVKIITLSEKQIKERQPKTIEKNGSKKDNKAE